MPFDGVYAVLRQGMRADIFVLPVLGQHLLPREFMNKLRQSLGRDFGAVEKAHGRRIRRGFLRTAKTHKIAHGYLRASGNAPCDNIGATAGRPRRNGQNHAEYRLGRSVAHFCLAADKMAARNMACFVGDDARQLLGTVGKLKQAGIEKFVHSLGYESVHGAALNDNDGHAFGVDIGGAVNGGRKASQIIFNFGVADKRNVRTAVGFLRMKKRKRQHHQ